MANQHPIGIIGGSGLYQMEGVTIAAERVVETPFGKPSDAIMLGDIAGRPVAFLPRHGRGHRILPHEINFRANIFALKLLGVAQIISVSAVGSMKESIHPGNFVFVDQFIDRTKSRCDTFFGNGIAAHVSFADPVCEHLRHQLVAAAKKLSIRFHDRGTYVCIEGPMFSSRAESNVYRSWGVDVIGMTNYQEAKLAREAEMSYATVALATDYDCWREGEEVDVAKVVATLQQNVATVQRLLREVIPTLDPGSDDLPARTALKYAIMTDPKIIPAETKEKLEIIIGKYLK